jgi:two-component system, OmpR family, sensor histidine kinase BaeS
MRLRLFPQLFILIAATALVAELAMAGVMALNLQRGFSDYLAARDTEQLEMFTAAAGQRIAAAGGIEALTSKRITLHALLNDLAAAQGRPPMPGAPPPPPPGFKAGPRPGPDGRRPPPPEDFGARLFLLDPARRLIAGPPGLPPIPANRSVTRSIRVDGRTVAFAQLVPRAPAPGGVEARFLSSQYQGAALLAALLILLGALPAWGLARLGVRRLERIKLATDAIAGGNFSYRLPDAGKDELDDVSRNVNRMVESLSRLDTARRRWLAEVSHELRTPGRRGAPTDPGGSHVLE